MTDTYVPEHRAATHIDVISEENYAEVMQNEVEPFLEKYRTEGALTIVRGKRLHYEYYLCSDPVGAVVICHGFTESAEKFREMSYYFLRAGYSVFAVDHRGHGRSYREVEDTSYTHVEKFREYVDDFDLFVQKIVKPNAMNLPLYLFSHSMGGAIGGMYLTRCPMEFRKAVMSSPMIAASTNGVPHFAAAAVTDLFCLFGQKKERVFLYHDFSENEKFESSCDDSFARFEYYRKKRVEFPYLRNNSATYGWLKQALGVTRTLLKKSACATVQAKVLLFQAGADDIVLLKPQEKYIARIPHGELRRIEGAKHELYMTPNAVLQPYLDQILTFFAK